MKLIRHQRNADLKKCRCNPQDPQVVHRNTTAKKHSDNVSLGKKSARMSRHSRNPNKDFNWQSMETALVIFPENLILSFLYFIIYLDVDVSLSKRKSSSLLGYEVRVVKCISGAGSLFGLWFCIHLLPLLVKRIKVAMMLLLCLCVCVSQWKKNICCLTIWDRKDYSMQSLSEV